MDVLAEMLDQRLRRPEMAAEAWPPFLNQESFANVQGLGSLAVVRLERRLGKVPDQTLDLIRRA